MSSASRLLSCVFCCGTCQRQKPADNHSGLSSVSQCDPVSNGMDKTEIVENEEQVVHSLIQFVEEKSKAALAERDRFVMGLSGNNCSML